MLTDTQSSPAPVSSVVAVQTRFDFRSRLRIFVVFSIILTLCFIRPLFDLIRFALHSDLYSHILLVPFISAYLIWLNHKRRGLPRQSQTKAARETLISICLFLLGAMVLAIYFWARRSGHAFPQQDYLAFTV